MLEYGVFLGDIIPHIATLGHFPKKGSCPWRLRTPEDWENCQRSPSQFAPQPNLISLGKGTSSSPSMRVLNSSGGVVRISSVRSQMTHETVLSSERTTGWRFNFVVAAISKSSLSSMGSSKSNKRFIQP